MKKLFILLSFFFFAQITFGQTSINFKRVTGNVNAALVVDRIELNFQAQNATVYYQVIDTTKGEVLYAKPLRYDTNTQYPDYQTWYNNWNSTQFLIDEFWGRLTDDEKIFIVKN
jgi:hypothetical protein